MKKSLISENLKSGLSFPIELYDEKGNKIHYEDSYGYWLKSEYDEKGKKIYEENNDGEWRRAQYDERGNQIYFENSDGYWEKSEYDKNGKQIYYENSYDRIIDNRPKEVKEITMEELEKHFGTKVKVIK